MIAKKISALTATNLVVANMIGIGVFTSLGFQVAGITSDFALIALWIVGGIAALCGALSYAELATALPRSGGEYHYLSKIYHPSVGFLSGWISVVVGFPAPIALAGIAFGGYFKIFTPGISPIFLSLLIIWIITAVHLFGVRVEEMFQNGSTFLKIGLILVLIVAGLLIANPQPLNLIPGPEALTTLLSRPFAVDLVYVMYAYSGWNAAAYITDEVRNPAKNVPWALLIGTLVVTALYLTLNLRISAYHAQIGSGRSTRGRTSRWPSYFWPDRRKDCQRFDRSGTDCHHQRHGVDWSPDHQEDGRRLAKIASLGPKLRKRYPLCRHPSSSRYRDPPGDDRHI